MTETNYFIVQAPYPALASTMLLPSPQVGNNLGATSEVVIIKMMDGSRRSIVKKAGNNRRYRWTFVLSRDKIEEVQDFVLRYRGSSFRTIWRGNVVIGKLNLNPVEFAGNGRAGGWPGNEAYEVTLELIEL